MRVVLDTNVLISATVFEGSEAQKLVQELVRHGAKICCSQEMLEEYENSIRRDFVAKQKLEITKERLPMLVASIRKLATMVEAGGNIRVSRDPEDDKIIACALAGGYAYLVTYDADLLDIGTYDSVKIIKPAQMRKILEEEKKMENEKK